MSYKRYIYNYNLIKEILIHAVVLLLSIYSQNLKKELYSLFNIIDSIIYHICININTY